MKNIIFIAPPAAGKGTQSKLVSAEYNIPHISAGDLLRDEIKSGSLLGKQLQTEIDKGNLVSNDIMVRLLRNRISKVDCNNGYILNLCFYIFYLLYFQTLFCLFHHCFESTHLLTLIKLHYHKFCLL